MLVNVGLGHITPGRSERELVEFERRINRRYVEHVAEIAWDYLGVYRVSGLDGIGHAEVSVVDAPDVEEARRRDAEHEAVLSEDVRAMYDECRSLLWVRPSLRFWLTGGEGEPLPARGEALRLTLRPDARAAWSVERWSEHAGPPPGSADLSSVNAIPFRGAMDTPVPDAVPDPFASPPSLPLTLRLEPLVVAPLAAVWGR